MFIGHHAVGFASKRLAPRVSLGWLMAAPILLDLIWPILLLLGVEHVRVQPGNTAFTPLDFYDYPWTHSLVTSIGWGILFGGIYWLRHRDARAAAVLAAGVVSHWVFDWLVHRPDLPLWPHGPKEGLGIWNSVPATIAIESLLFVAGVALYARGTRSRDRIGSIGLWSFVAFLAIVDVANITGPPPPSARAVAIVSLLMWLFPLWCAWFDRHREVV